jgi:hypothetical protein
VQPKGKQGKSVTLEGRLGWADRAYFIAAATAALATVITVVVGFAQHSLNARISENKDRALAEFRLTSETRVKELESETAVAKLEGEKANERAKNLTCENLRSASCRSARKPRL